LRHWRGDDPGSLCGSGVAGGRPNRHRKGMNGLALQVQQGLGRDPHAGDLYVFRGARGDLIKIVWHDRIDMSLYANYLASHCISSDCIRGL
jgi:transposase